MLLARNRIVRRHAADIVRHRWPLRRVNGSAPAKAEGTAAMKIASSSASFARPIAAGELTQLEWLDLCANELEVDGVVFDAAEFPRLDADYVAQLKKSAADLGLTVTALAADDAFAAQGDWLDVAVSLGAPLLVANAPLSGDGAEAWGTFTEALRARAGQAKRANVTLAVRNAPGTLCASVSDVQRLLKDVDSAWLRCALDPSALGGSDLAEALLGKAVVALHAIDDLERFATQDDPSAATLVARLERFRGFVVLEGGDQRAPSDAYHSALERFAALRCTALTKV